MRILIVLLLSLILIISFGLISILSIKLLVLCLCILSLVLLIISNFALLIALARVRVRLTLYYRTCARVIVIIRIFSRPLRPEQIQPHPILEIPPLALARTVRVIPSPVHSPSFHLVLFATAVRPLFERSFYDF